MIRYYLKKLLIILLVLILPVASLSGCAFKEKVEQFSHDLSKTAQQWGKDVYTWGTNIDFSIFSKGWDYASKFVSSQYSTFVTSEYIQNVGKQIEVLKTDINSTMNTARGIAQEAGFAAEKWAVDTFNIQAAASNSGESAFRPDSNAGGSADIETSWGEEYSLKYYQTFKLTAVYSAQYKAHYILSPLS